MKRVPAKSAQAVRLMSAVTFVLGVVAWTAGSGVSAEPPAASTGGDARVAVKVSAAQRDKMLENMRTFLVATQGVVGAANKADFAALEAAAAQLGHSAEKEKRARAAAGDQTAFAELAVAFMKSGDRIGDAARKKDATAALAALEATLATCNGCHASYRFEVTGR